jgi:hypothetical protein
MPDSIPAEPDCGQSIPGTPGPTDEWCRGLCRDLQGPRGVVRIRIGPGLLRNLGLAHATFGWPIPADRVAAVETACGTEKGFFGPDGLERFLAAVRRCRLVDGVGSLPTVDVHVAAGTHPFSADLPPSPWWPPAAEIHRFLSDAGLVFSPGGSVGAKAAFVSGGFVAVRDWLTGRDAVFIGAPRTRAFSRMLGVHPDRHVVIPDHGSYGLTDHIIALTAALLASPRPRPPVVLHAASLVGNTVLLELADAGHAFVGVDLGLAAAVCAEEYLAHHSWFVENGPAILRTRDRLEASSPIDPADRHARTLAWFEGWRQATRAWRTDPRGAVDLLAAAVAGNDDLRLPIARASLVLWKASLGEAVAPESLAALLDEQDQHEPAAMAAAALHMLGRPAEARAALDRAGALCPLDQVVPRLRRACEETPAGQAAAPAIAAAVTFVERPYLGSSLSWSLYGDLPHRWPEIPRTPF